MGAFVTMVSDVFSTILPGSDWAKLLALMVIIWCVFVITGKFKLEWIGFAVWQIGLAVRHVTRWTRCKTRDKHHYVNTGPDLMMPSWDILVCRICSKRHGSFVPFRRTCPPAPD